MSRGKTSRMEEIESQLKGKTLIVYWHLLRSSSSPVGVREVQRALGFSSPSVAHHHLEKLHSLGLVKRSITGEYSLAQEVKVGFLRMFTRMGRFMVPRYLFYSVMLTTMLVVYGIMFWGVNNIHSLMVYIFGSIASGISWYETYRIWREKPF